MVTQAYLSEKQWSQSISSVFSCEREESLHDMAIASKTLSKNCKVFITSFISDKKHSCSTYYVPGKYILHRAKNLGKVLYISSSEYFTNLFLSFKLPPTIKVYLNFYASISFCLSVSFLAPFFKLFSN